MNVVEAGCELIFNCQKYDSVKTLKQLFDKYDYHNVPCTHDMITGESDFYGQYTEEELGII